MPDNQLALRGVRDLGVGTIVQQLWSQYPELRRTARDVWRAFQQRQRQQAFQESRAMPMRKNFGTQTQRAFIADHSSYQQFSKYRFKSGRKRSAGSKRQSILQTIISNYRLRISRLSDLSAGQGAYFLGHGVLNANEDVLPLLMCNLTSVRQGNASPSPMMRGTMFTAPGFDGNIQFQAVNSQSVNNAGVPSDNPQWQYEDNEGNLNAVGRKSYLDWCRIRLTLWGKQNAPAKYAIRLVKFSNEEYCPDNQSFGVGLPPNGTAFYQALMKPLITDPSASMLVFPKGAMKILKQWKVEFDPISTTEADQDPHCKALDIFHRFGKQMDYTIQNRPRVTAAQVDDARHFIENDDTTGATASNFAGYPRRHEDSIYLMITSLQQDKQDVPDRTVTSSLSWNIQVAHKTVQPDLFLGPPV